jgi:hypothetical protein
MAPRSARDPIAPFADNTEFLEMKLNECLLRLEYVGQCQDFDPAGPPRTSTDPFEHRYLRFRSLSVLRLERTPAVRIPFRELCAEHLLGPIEQDAVWLLFLQAVSPVFRQRLAAAELYSFGPDTATGLYLGTLLQILSPDPGIQIHLLAHFQPDAVLRQRDLVRLEGPYTEDGGLTLETRVYLRDPVQAAIRGA